MFKVDTEAPPLRFYEDFGDGAAMPVVGKGPMTAGHQVRWAGASDNYASDFHHDAAAARAVGLPGLLLSGPFMACLMLTEVSRWLGAQARVVSFWDRNSGTTMPGDMAHIHAVVRRRWVEDGRGLVEIDCDIRNQDGKSTTPGGLVAELPLRPGTGQGRGSDAGQARENGVGQARENGVGRAQESDAGRAREATTSEDREAAAIGAALKALEGPLGPPDSMPIESLSVRRMALTVGSVDPIHYDEAAARSRGYRGIVAPWPLLWLAFFNCREAPLRFGFGKATIHGGERYEFHEPLIVGDVVTVQATVVETSVKRGKAGPMGVIVTRREFRNQHGRLCAVMATTNLRL